VNAEVPWEDDVSVVLESSVPVAVERALYFNRGGGNSGGSLARGANKASSQFFFSEGTVRPGFEEYLAVFNPSAIVEARIGVELRGAGKDPIETTCNVAPLSRLTVKVNDLAEQGDYSMVLRSSTPVVAERSEYFVYNDILTGSHSASGAVRPSGRWYFAEGTTRDFFDGYLSVFNPCAVDTWLEVRMVTSDGALVKEDLDLAAGERKTLYLDAYLPPEIDYSLSVSSLLPITAERSVYFRSHNIAGGFCSPGVTQASDRWLFPEGCTGPGFTEYLAIFNPQASPQLATVEFLRGDGETVSREYMLPAEGRVTIDVGIEAGQSDEMSIDVSSEIGIVVERSLYFNFQTW
jgi:hypothetical protein